MEDTMHPIQIEMVSAQRHDADVRRSAERQPWAIAEASTHVRRAPRRSWLRRSTSAAPRDC
jgi:hypothetical protein